MTVECKLNKWDDKHKKTKNQKRLFKVKGSWFEEEQLRERISKSHPRPGEKSLFFSIRENAEQMQNM